MIVESQLWYFSFTFNNSCDSLHPWLLLCMCNLQGHSNHGVPWEGPHWYWRPDQVRQPNSQQNANPNSDQNCLSNCSKYVDPILARLNGTSMLKLWGGNSTYLNNVTARLLAGMHAMHAFVYYVKQAQEFKREFMFCLNARNAGRYPRLQRHMVQLRDIGTRRRRCDSIRLIAQTEQNIRVRGASTARLLIL